MKKFLALAMLFGLFALPVMAQVEAGAGKITVHVNIDVLGKYIREDENIYRSDPDAKDRDQVSTEDIILRDTIFALMGEISDKVSWELTSMWTSEPEILTARVDLKLIPMTTIRVGRFIPDQGKAFQYHILSRVHTIYLPLAAMMPNYGPPENTGALLVPFFQTGAQVTVGNETAHLSAGYFNGLEPQVVGAPPVLTAAGANNFMELDNSKAGLVKVGVNASGVEAGIHWWNEYANVDHYAWGTDDAHIQIYGAYVGYTHEKFHVLAEYLENQINLLDDRRDTDPLEGTIMQNDWYVQAGVSPVKDFELVCRYETMDGFDLKRDNSKKNSLFWTDEETWITLGATYYLLNKNAAVSVQHIWKDHDELDWKSNELSLLVELDL